MSQLIADENIIQNKIYTIRGMQVMLDRDLAEIYGVETKRINEAVKRNVEKFPSDLMFEVDHKEYDLLRSQNATLKSKYLPKVFTEQGIYMLATVLKSHTATQHIE